jgi:hypothetical protein
MEKYKSRMFLIQMITVASNKVGRGLQWAPIANMRRSYKMKKRIEFGKELMCLWAVEGRFSSIFRKKDVFIDGLGSFTQVRK